MATSVKLTLTDAASGDVDEPYQLTLEYTEASPASGNWDGGNFVLVKVGSGDVTTDEYQHICTVGDLEAYPASRSGLSADDYYRVATWSVTLETLEAVATAKAVFQTRTQNLVDDWENYVTGSGWPATDAVVYSSP